MSDLPLVSVVVATYRREHELKRALSSLAEQSFSSFEIILVDDNDHLNWNCKVKMIAEEFQKRYPVIPLLYIQNHPNLGSALARNAGIDAAQGEYITFLDDDDLYLANKIAEQYEFMLASDLDFSITDIALYYNDERLSERRVRSYIKNNDNASLIRYHLMHHLTGTDTMMFKKVYLEKIDGFAPIDVGDEFYLIERAIKHGGKFGYLARCDVKAYVHRGDVGLSSGQGKIDGENRLFEHKKQYFNQLDKKSVRYIRMRHHAVLAFAFFRMKKILRCFYHGLESFMISPVACIWLLCHLK